MGQNNDDSRDAMIAVNSRPLSSILPDENSRITVRVTYQSKRRISFKGLFSDIH